MLRVASESHGQNARRESCFALVFVVDVVVVVFIVIVVVDYCRLLAVLFPPLGATALPLKNSPKVLYIVFACYKLCLVATPPLAESLSLT